MAQLTLSLTFITCLILMSSSSSEHDHHHSQHLDISSALRLARQVFQRPSLLHHHHQTRLSTTATSNSNSTLNSLSLVLRPHISNLADFNNNYTALVLFRLERDKARMARLMSSKNLQAPVVSGASQGSGEYFARVGLGTPVQNLSMLVDTGSDTTWVQCKPCRRCYTQSDPLFDPKASSTYNRLPCYSPLCERCQSGVCTYKVSYGDGSETIGTMATETFSFGSPGSIANVAFGCGTYNRGLFNGSDGLMGLGGKPQSLPSQFNATSFSYCFVNRDSDSSSTLDFNSPPPDDSVVAQMIINQGEYATFHYVNFTGISVAGNSVGIPARTFVIGRDGSGGVIVDSGTTITMLVENAYVIFRNAFMSAAPRDWRQVDGVGILDTCYDLSGSEDTMVPTVSFIFGGNGTLTLPPENTMIPVDDAGTFCLAFANSGDTSSIIGNVQQQGTRVTYDLANKVIGFSPNKC